MNSDNVAEVEELPTAMSDEPNGALQEALEVLSTLQATIKKQVLGRDDVIELAIVALIADGHILLEDFPGSGKTTLAKALGEAIDNGFSNDESIVPFRRIQFTPDLLPSDVTGVPVFDSNSNAFHFRHGPLCTCSLIILQSVVFGSSMCGQASPTAWGRSHAPPPRQG